ncbi:hypothetical protein ACTXT7_005793 [Hymenolepis weldensis]
MGEVGGGMLGSFYPLGHQKLTPMATSRWRTRESSFVLSGRLCTDGSTKDKAISNDADNKGGTAAEMKRQTIGAPLVAKDQRSSKVAIATTLIPF